MTKIVLLAHGGLARALRQTALDISGPISQLIAVDLAVDYSVEDFMERVHAIVVEGGQESILFLTDLYGGTPWRVAGILAHEEKPEGKISVISGMNLAMVLEACNLVQNDISLEVLTEQVRTAGVKDICSC
jgi:mannose/fructose-specific phosphotransferase system component IIA